MTALTTALVFSLSWVLLKNVHLAPQWLVALEKKLHSITPHANFRLFLTMEINPKVSHCNGSCGLTHTYPYS